LRASVNAILAVSAVLCGVAAAQNQQVDWDKQTYLTVLSLKALPGQGPALAEFYKSGPGAKTIQARIKRNPNLMRWTLLRNVYPGDAGASADYVIGISVKGTPSEPDQALNEQVAREFAGMSYGEYLQKVRLMTTQVGQSLSHIHHATQGYAPAEGDYLVIRRLKAIERQQGTMMDLARDVQLALAEVDVKRGAAKGWSFSHLAFPTGSSTDYDATEVVVYKDLASAAIAAGPVTSTRAAARFAEQFPGKSYTSYVDSLRASTKVVRADLYRVVVAHRQ
jgi:hypothetical protein